MALRSRVWQVIWRMDDDFLGRGFLLPDGWKDWAEHYCGSPTPPESSIAKPMMNVTWSQSPFPIIHGKMRIPEKMTVRELAVALSKKTFQIVGDLIPLKIFAKQTTELDFNTIAIILRKYGVIAERAN